MIGEWLRQGADGLIATQKILLDLAAQQNALVLTIARERLGLRAPIPSKSLLELARKGLQILIEAEKTVLDMAARQNQIVQDGFRPGVAGTPLEGVTDIAHRTFYAFIHAQKQFLDVFDRETEGLLRDWKAGRPFEVQRVSEIARAAVRDFVKIQKKFLTIVEERLTAKKEEMAEPEDANARVCLIEMAKESVDSFVEAQKHLLDLVGSEVEVGERMVRELFSFDFPDQPTTTVSEVMKKSVESFVAAQKALAELASKPRTESDLN
jgi:hypothetical protein